MFYNSTLETSVSSEKSMSNALAIFSSESIVGDTRPLSIFHIAFLLNADCNANCS